MPPRAAGRARGMSGWPIRRKLAALVAPPLVIILAAGSLLGFSAFRNLQAANRAQVISTAIVVAGQATLALQEEINQAIVGSSIGAVDGAVDKNDQARLNVLTAKTDLARRQLLTTLADPPSDGWSADVSLNTKEIAARETDLKTARADAKSQRNASFADTAYQRTLQKHLALTNALARDLTTATSDARLASAATTIAAMSGLADAAASERTEGAVLLSKAPVVAGDVISAQSLGNYLSFIQTQAIQAEIAQRFATQNARTLLNDAQSQDNDALEQFRRDVIQLTTGIEPSADARIAKSRAFSEVAGQRIKRLDVALTGMAQDTRTIASEVSRAALLRTGLVSGIALVMLVIGVLLAAAIAKTVTVPLRRLRSAAVEAATVRLPAAVRQIERQGPDAVPALPPVLPPGTAAGPETIEVAQAVDGLTTEALRLATAQVRLRQAIDEAFVSMSRRSQSMVEKQLSIIDELESTEEDPDQLRNLFRLDHLAARMRRYNDNLLVLAGSTVRTRSAAPVPVADIFRAATSEMEQYERVRLQPISGTAIAGPAAGGLIHLLAELLDNAAMYSPPTSPILLTAQFTPDGGLHLEVTDSGVGIPPNELAELNARLGTPGTLDAQVPSRMGLFVVARLAQRGGLRVRLSPRTNAAGTVAEVIVPPALVAGGPAGESQPAAFGDMPASTGPAGPGLAGPATGGFGLGSPSSAPSTPFSSPAPATPAAGSPAQRPAAAPFTQPTYAPAAAAAAASNAANGAPVAPMPRRSGPTPGSGAIPQVTGTGAPLPSRRPGAVLSGGPLGQPRPTEPAPTPPPGSPGLFGVAPATSGNPFEPVVPAEHSPEPDDVSRTGSRPPVRGATAAWAARSEAAAAAGLPTRTRGASMPPVLGGPGAAAGPMSPIGSPGVTPMATSRPAADSPTAVPPAPSMADRATPRTGPEATFGTGSAAAAATGSETSSDLPRRTRGAAPAVGTPPGAPFAAPTVLPTPQPGAGTPAADPKNSDEARPAPGTTTDRPAATVTPIGIKAPPVQEVTDNRPTMGEGAALTGEVPRMPRGSDFTPGGAKSSATVLPPVTPTGKVAGNGSSNGTANGSSNGSSNGAANGSAPASNGSAPAAWNPALPTELAARSAVEAAGPRYRPANPNAPMIGTDSSSESSTTTPIFDSISVWFSTDASAPTTGSVEEVERVVDLRDGARPTVTSRTSSRWAALGDQQWLAASARAAATPQISGTTQTGLPMRRPGANLVPSAVPAVTASVGAGGRPSGATSTMPPAPVHRADPEAVRGRLGSYQRGLTSARRSRRAPGDEDALFTGSVEINETDANGTTKTPEGTGGDT